MAVDPIDLVAARMERDEDYSLPQRPGMTRAGAGQKPDEPTLSDKLLEGLAAFTEAELDAEAVPHPHLFWAGEEGLFPIGEPAVVAGVQRGGKTTVMVGGVAVSLVLGRAIGQFSPPAPRGVVVVTLEDAKAQILELIKPEAQRLTKPQRAHLRGRLRVLDLRQPIYARARPLVIVHHGQPCPNYEASEALTVALEQLARQIDVPLGMVIFETASRMSDAAEDNVGFRVLADLAHDIARRLQVAVVIMHHISQAADGNLRTLEISTGDVRGGTALVMNTRQTWMVLNLGSDKIPHKDGDARTMLRKLVNPSGGERVTALINLDSSKSQDPRPLFFRWEGTRQVPIDLSPRLASMAWWELHRQIGCARADEREAAQGEKLDIEARRAAAACAVMVDEGVQPTASAVSGRIGAGKSGATRMLARAVDLGLLKRGQEKVPRAGLCDVYRPVDDA